MGRYVNPVIEPNRTPVVRLYSVIIALKLGQPIKIERSISERSPVLLNQTCDYQTPVCFVRFFFLERFSSLIMITPEQFTYQKMESEQT